MLPRVAGATRKSAQLWSPPPVEVAVVAVHAQAITTSSRDAVDGCVDTVSTTSGTTTTASVATTTVVAAAGAATVAGATTVYGY